MIVHILNINSNSSSCHNVYDTLCLLRLFQSNVHFSSCVSKGLNLSQLIFPLHSFSKEILNKWIHMQIYGHYMAFLKNPF